MFIHLNTIYIQKEDTNKYLHAIVKFIHYLMFGWGDVLNCSKSYLHMAVAIALCVTGM